MSGRIRTIKPEWLEDERLAALSSDARVLSIGLLLLADDYGCGRANHITVGAAVFAFSKDAAGSARRALLELEGIGFLVLYKDSGQSYFAIRNWAKHQKVNHVGKRRVPEPPQSVVGAHPEKSNDSNAKEAEQDSAETLSKSQEGLLDAEESLLPDLRPLTNDHDHDQQSEFKLENPNPPAPDSLDVAWADYIGAARQAGRKEGRLPALNESRRSLLRARITECGLDHVRAAARGVWIHDWARPGGTCNDPAGKCAPEYAFRNAERVEEYAAAWDAYEARRERRRAMALAAAAQPVEPAVIDQSALAAKLDGIGLAIIGAGRPAMLAVGDTFKPQEVRDAGE